MSVDSTPPVRDSRDERLVSMETTQVRCLHAYHAQGLPGACARTYLREGVAQRLLDVDDGLPAGFRLVIFDGWRSLVLQEALQSRALRLDAEQYVAAASRDPLFPPPHLTGGSVDLSLMFDGIPLALGSSFDEFSSLAHTSILEASPGIIREGRRLLYWSMREQDFVVHELEWWHYEYGTPRWSAIVGRPPLYGATQPLICG
jgi:zinc D-Ala-D-Ala dipeptidase